MRRGLIAGAFAATAALFLWIQWLRWLEPPGLDQSLFVLYGKWIGHGLAPYVDLWDSKPPALFALYTLAQSVAGLFHAPRLLDGVAAAASWVLAFRLLRGERGAAGESGARLDVGAWVAALLAALVPSAPAFGGPRVAGQPEVLAAPLVLGAALAFRHGKQATVLLGGALLGGAACLKIVNVVLLPLAWAFVPAATRRDLRQAALVLAGWLLPVALCFAWLVSCGAWHEAVQAVLVFPRAYGAEIASRIPFGPALQRAASGLGQGLPLVLVLAVVGATAPPRRPLAAALLAWLALALAGAVAQRQLVDYQLFVVTTPLVLLAGRGAGWLWARAGRMSNASRPGTGRRVAWIGAAAVGLVLGGMEVRSWTQHYATHVACRRGQIDRDTFALGFGRPGLMWVEAEKLSQTMPDPRSLRAGPLRESILVWGLAPAVYALSGCQPATRFVFHQTLLVEGSALARRWPDVQSRQAELLERMHHDPPRFIVVVHGDRSGLEPRDSAAELEDFAELDQILEQQYQRRSATRSYELFERAEREREVE